MNVQDVAEFFGQRLNAYAAQNEYPRQAPYRDDYMALLLVSRDNDGYRVSADKVRDVLWARYDHDLLERADGFLRLALEQWDHYRDALSHLASCGVDLAPAIEQAKGRGFKSSAS